MGTSIYNETCGRIAKDHPHACGDKKRFCVRSISDVGIIPTRVGTSSFVISILYGIRDHPHACGDKMPLLPKSRAKKGSSPRVWGQDVYQKYDGNQPGIIPTRVGTSIRFRQFSALPRDHPHACGDKAAPAKPRLFQKGSSPRVWGQGNKNRKAVKPKRIIPTRVGTSEIFHP